MAIWQRLSYEWVARVSAGGLYGRGFGSVGRILCAGDGGRPVSCNQTNVKGQLSVEEVKPFPAVERRRNPAARSEQREAGELAVFQELGKALTSSLQLDQVLRTIMEKIDEFLRPDNWSLLLVDEATPELYFELAVGQAHSRADHHRRLHHALQRAPHGLHSGNRNLPFAALQLRIFHRVHRPRPFQAGERHAWTFDRLEAAGGDWKRAENALPAD